MIDLTAVKLWWEIIIGIFLIFSALYIVAGWMANVLKDSYQGDK